MILKQRIPDGWADEKSSLLFVCIDVNSKYRTNLFEKVNCPNGIDNYLFVNQYNQSRFRFEKKEKENDN